MEFDDDYYYDSFENYEETTTDPGPWMLVGTVSYSACCVLLLPLLVMVSKSCQRKKAPKITSGRDLEMTATNSEHKTQLGNSPSADQVYESNKDEIYHASSQNMVLNDAMEQKTSTIHHFCSKLISIAKIDKESKSILKLGIPMSLSEVAEAVFEAIIVALISRNLGVNALSAYVITNFIDRPIRYIYKWRRRCVKHCLFSRDRLRKL
jgi:hypothetical protein